MYFQASLTVYILMEVIGEESGVQRLNSETLCLSSALMSVVDSKVV